MKKAIVFYFLLCNFSVTAQSLYKSCFSGCYLLPGTQFVGVEVMESTDGNGSISLSNFVYSDSLFFLTRLDSTGALIWNKIIETDVSELHFNNSSDTIIVKTFLNPISIVDCVNNGYYIGAIQDSLVELTDSLGMQTNFDSTSIILSHIDTAGNMLWSKKIKTPTPTYLSKIIFENNFVYSLSKGVSPNDSLLYLIKSDTTGATIWARTFSNFPGNINKVDFVLNGTAIYISGTFNPDVFLIKTDTSGNIGWSNIIGSGIIDEMVSIVPTTNGCALGVNRAMSPKPASVIVDLNGTVISSKAFSGSSNFRLTHFIAYGGDRLLMIQQFDTILSNALYKELDMWILDSVNNFTLHENLLSYTSYFPNTYGTSIRNILKTPKGILAMIQDWEYLNPFGVYAYLHDIVQMDSIAKGCFFQPIISNNNFVVNQTIVAAPLVITNTISAVTTSDIDILSSNFLIPLTVACSTGVGVNDFAQSFGQLKLYPSPFSNQLKIECINCGVSEIILYDITSRKLLQRKFTDTIEIETNFFAKGVYIYKIIHPNGLSKQGKIIKQ